MLYAISDLHLSLNSNKPMDVFGDQWGNYTERLKSNWQSTVGGEDIVVIPGDISWGMTLEECLPDFEFLNQLNGRKLILKGNHDYFWNTAKKLNEFFIANGLSSFTIIHNNAFLIGDMAICGTKGFNWNAKLTAEQNQKLHHREAERLEASIVYAKKAGAKECIVFMHYPPILSTYRAEEILQVLLKHGIKRCFFGHIHGSGMNTVPQGSIEGVEMSLISADYLQFSPKKI
jgi:predicted phosphohydrolase